MNKPCVKCGRVHKGVIGERGGWVDLKKQPDGRFDVPLRLAKGESK